MVSFHCNLQQWKVFLPHVYLEVNIKGDYKVSHDLPRAGRLHWNLGRTFSKPRISVRSIAVSLNTSLGAWSWAPKGNSAPTQLIWDLLALVTSLIYHHRETPSIYFSFLRRLYFKTPFYELVKPSLYVLVENPIKKCLPAPFLSAFLNYLCFHLFFLEFLRNDAISSFIVRALLARPGQQSRSGTQPQPPQLGCQVRTSWSISSSKILWQVMKPVKLGDSGIWSEMAQKKP